MADYADESAAAESVHLSAAISNRPRNPVGESARECDDCGGKIPEGRRKAVPGCRRCVRCQTMEERCGGEYA